MSIDDATVQDWDRAFNRGAPQEWVKNNVERPPHYNKGSIECIDSIEAMLTSEEFIGYLRGNSLKYRWRMRYKGKAIEDLKKAEWYDNKLLDFLERNPDVLG